MSYLKTVVQHLNDSVRGLKECTKLTHNNELNHFLIKLSDQREDFSQELKSIVNDDAIDTNKGSIAGTLHSFYIQLKATIKSNNLDDIKQEILRGDRVLIESYNKAIQHETNEDIKTILSSHLHSIHQDLLVLSNRIHKDSIT